jgi:hypothetical protein
LSGTRDVENKVKALPADPEAAAVLKGWAAQEDSLLDVAGLDLTDADISGADLANGLLTETVLRKANLSGCDLYRANLEGAVLAEADLSNASLVKAVLDEASLAGANLDGADLGSAELWGVDASGASLRGSKLEGAAMLETKLYGADLSHATVRETSFKVFLDDRSIVEGLTGTVFGPARVAGAEGVREVNGQDLELWLSERGARVEVLTP